MTTPSLEVARRLMQASAPRSPHVHLLSTGHESPPAPGEGRGEGTPSGRRQFHVFLPDGSRLFDADARLASRLEAAIEAGHAESLLHELGVTGAPYVDDTPLEAPPVHALSFAIAQKCNLGCTYPS